MPPFLGRSREGLSVDSIHCPSHHAFNTWARSQFSIVAENKQTFLPVRHARASNGCKLQGPLLYKEGTHLHTRIIPSTTRPPGPGNTCHLLWQKFCRLARQHTHRPGTINTQRVSHHSFPFPSSLFFFFILTFPLCFPSSRSGGKRGSGLHCTSAEADSPLLSFGVVGGEIFAVLHEPIPLVFFWFFWFFFINEFSLCAIIFCLVCIAMRKTSLRWVDWILRAVLQQPSSRLLVGLREERRLAGWQSRRLLDFWILPSILPTHSF